MPRSSPAAPTTGGRFPEPSRAEVAERLEATNRQLRSLLQLGRGLNAELSPRGLLALAPRLLAEHTGFSTASLELRDLFGSSQPADEAYGPELAVVAPLRGALRPVSLHDGRTLVAGQVLARPLLIADVSGDLPPSASAREAVLPREVLHLARQVGICSLALVPLVARGDEVVGLAVLYDRRPHPELANDEAIEYFAQVGEQAGIAFQNAHFHAATRRELRRRDALRRVVESISSELDLGSLLERVAASAVELLEATCGSISLCDAQGAARLSAVHNMPHELVGRVFEAGEGITGQVLAAQAPVLVSDYSRDVPRPLPELQYLHAAIAVPVWWQSQLVGVFTVFSGDLIRSFSDGDREVMELLANHVAIALENARLYGELQSRLGEMVSLQRLGTLLLEERDFDRVLQAICEQLLQLTDATGVGLLLLEETQQFLEMRTVVGPSAEQVRGVRIPVVGSFAGEALRTNQPQRSDDVEHDPRGYRPSLEIGRTKTILSVPLKTRQRSVGAISIYNKRGEGGFTDRDAEVATLFATQAAVAIENARLYEQTREYAVIEERNRLARELHDSVTQSLFSVTLLVQAALNLWDRDRAKARERLERANELAQGALAEMRALIFELRPISLQEEGLLLALKKHIAALRSREGLDVALRLEGSERRLPGPVEEAAFRIVQESLNNVVKHARASQAGVEVVFGDVTLKVCTHDNGVGFNPATRLKLRTIGMASMRERAEAVHGRVRVESEPGRGTRVLAEIPIPAPAPEKELAVP